MSFKQWSHNTSRDVYTGTHETVDQLPSGLYHFKTDNWGNPLANRKQQKDERLCEFRNGPAHEIVEEIRRFWSTGEHYKNLGVTHKRGVLLHGPPGCGKTGIVQLVIRDTIERKGVVTFISGVDHFRSCMPLLRQIEPGRPVLGVIEDIERICEYGEEEELLELMDGSTSMGHGILFLATTNNLDEVPKRIRCRPSRIDTLLEIGQPGKPQRQEYLEFVAGQSSFDVPAETLATWASQTEGFSLAALKELLISVVVFQKTSDEAIARIRELEGDDFGEDETPDEPSDKARALVEEAFATLNPN